MEKPIFKKGIKVLYVPKDANGNVYKRQPGIIKSVTGKHAYVWYHDGCTAARTKMVDLELTANLSGEKFGNIHRGCEQCLKGDINEN